MPFNWRQSTDWIKESPTALKIGDFLGRGRGRWRFIDGMYRPPECLIKPNLETWERSSLAAIWIGHASILLRIDGYTVLMDPVLSTRVGIGLGLATVGPARKVAPALSHHDLPKIDLLLISHAHFDHLDRPTLARLSKSIPVIAAHHTRDLLRDLGYRQIRELSWGESVQFKELTITARQVKHWGARTFRDVHRSFNAYLIQSKNHRVLFGGDSAFQNYFEDIGASGGVDLAILGIGAYDPYLAAHASPEQAWEMAQLAGAKLMLPMHHSTFRLSHEPMHEPIERLLNIAGADSKRIVIQKVGEQFEI